MPSPAKPPHRYTMPSRWASFWISVFVMFTPPPTLRAVTAAAASLLRAARSFAYVRSHRATSAISTPLVFCLQGLAAVCLSSRGISWLSAPLFLQWDIFFLRNQLLENIYPTYPGLILLLGYVLGYFFCLDSYTYPTYPNIFINIYIYMHVRARA